MTNEFTLKPAIKGLATEFSKADQPPEFAQTLTNRFINLDGDAETRPGLENITSPIETTAAYGGKWSLFHEHVKKDGNTVLFASKYIDQDESGEPIDNGVNAYQLVVDSSAGWVNANVLNSNSSSSPFLTMGFAVTNGFTADTNVDCPVAVQFSDKSVFVAKNIQPFYYDENTGITKPLNSVISAGVMGTQTSAAGFSDANITNWANETLVAPNDIVWNITRNSWGIVTSVGTAKIEHTPITVATSGALGLGITESNAPNVGGTQTQGDAYEIWDMVENNFYPINPNLTQFDNVVIAATGTNTSAIAVSSNILTKAGTVLRQGDYVYNATRNSLSRISTISNRTASDGLLLSMVASNFTGEVEGQTSGDTLVFLKSAVPVASYAHVHYGRLYLVDSREPSRVFISAPDDFRDFTTFQEEVNASSIDYGARQPKGEEILSLDTFQRYLVAAGRRNIYVSQGVDPIVDTTAVTTDLAPVGLFTQGAASKNCLANIGSNMLYASGDGLRQFNVTDILAVDTNNVSEVIKSEVRAALESSAVQEKDIQVIHYPKRNWVMFKIGNTIYNYNYTPVYIEGQMVAGGSWSKFTGRFAECHKFIVRSNGDIAASWYDSTFAPSVSARATYFFEFDQGNANDGTAFLVSGVSGATTVAPINTSYETAWVGPGDGKMIHNRYVRPFLDCTTDQSFTMTITADLENERVDDTITVSANGGGQIIQNWQVNVSPIGGVLKTNRDKYGLRTHTDYFKTKIETSGGTRNVISKLIFYGNPYDTR